MTPYTLAARRRQHDLARLEEAIGGAHAQFESLLALEVKTRSK